LAKNGLGYILGYFSQTYLVTLDGISVGTATAIPVLFNQT
jgi:hypothetical protein